MKFEATLDPGSTAGNARGQLLLSFNANGDYLDSRWNPAYLKQTFTIPGSMAQVSLSFTVGQEGVNEFNLYAGMNFSDPRIQSPQFQSNFPITLAGQFIPKQPGKLSWADSTGDVVLTDGNARRVGTINISFSLLVEFDGTSGTGAGTWSVKYNIDAAPTC